MANPILAAIFGGLQGGLQGHGLDVQRQERKDAARIALEERARKRLMDRIALANAGVHEGTVPTEGTPDALPGISRVPAPDGTQDPLAKLSPLQKDRRMQEMTDEDFGAPSGKAPVAPAYNPANVAARSPAPGRGVSSRTPGRYVQLDQGHFMDREDTPEARARQRILDAYTRAGMTPEAAGASEVNPGLADNYLFPKADPTTQQRNIDPLSDEGIEAAVRRAKALRPFQRQSTEKPDPTQVVVTPDGIAIVNKKSATSTRVAAPGDSTAGAQLQAAQRNPLRAKAIENRTRLRTIDEALSALSQNPNAVGIKRGIPLVGDFFNQRYDKEGIGARAAIADIGSLVLHTRSGAAITVSEWPRLAPFVPKITDTAQAAREKLTRLKALIEAETEALEAGGGSAAAPASQDSSIAAKYGITPSVP